MDLTTEAIRLGINMARARAEVASTNIANVDVPGYRVQRANFAQAIGLLHRAVMQPSMAGEQLRAAGAVVSHGSVHLADPAADAAASLDGEVAELETASVDFQSLTTVLSRRFALMQLAMAGRN